MSNLQEAAQQALEALEYHVEQTRPIHRTSKAITAIRAALAEPVQEPDVPATNFGNMEPVGWLESPRGAFRANPLYKIQFPSQLLSWQVPVFAALAEPEPAAPTEYEVAPNGRRSAVLTAMMNARTRAEAALAEQPCSCGKPSAFGVVHLKNGPCYVLSKLEPAAPTPYTEADCLAAEKKWSAPAAPTVVEPEPVAWLHEEGLKAITDDEKDGWIQSGRGSVVAGYSVPLYRRAAQ